MGEFRHYTDCLGRRLTLIRGRVRGADQNQNPKPKLEEIAVSLFKESYVTRPESLRLAIIGDTHGHMTLALETLSLWADYTGLSIDAMLQVGDLITFDDQTNLDRVTKEMAEKDPEELGFRNYLHRTQEADNYFGRKGKFSDVPFFFIDGNHDDLRVAETFDKTSPYKNLKYLPSGDSATITKGPITAKISALGWHHKPGHVRKLSSYENEILLMHDFPESDKLKSLSKNARYTFFGHLHDAAPPLSTTTTNTYGLNEVRKKRGELKPDSLGVLDISENDSLFIYLPQPSLYAPSRS